MSPAAAAGGRARLAGAATALMCALAGGAAWAALAIHLRHELPAFIFAIALVAAWAVRSGCSHPGAVEAIVAASCVALAALYAAGLQAMAATGAMFELSAFEAMRRMDAAMILDLALLRLRGWELAIDLAAMLLAAWWASRRRPG